MRREDSGTMEEPRWLQWARELQGLAQTGLAFTKDPYDRERYERLRAMAAEMMAAQADLPASRIATLFASETGYATPKVEVRAGVFDDRGRILLVREALDRDRWTLPGGWADVNLTAVQNVAKEVREESGYEVRVGKLAAVWDRARQGHPPAAWSCYKLFFLCSVTGGAARTSLETSEVAWFGEHEIPSDISLGRVLPGQIARLFTHAADPALPTDVDRDD
jgi:ADP-ribose pyrophosphatase YjhB (NUDIX family)